MASSRSSLGTLAVAALLLALTACSPATPGAESSETVVSVVVRAESDAGGRALELERDGDAWEVHVAANGRVSEVRVSADGSQVLSRGGTDALEGEDRAELEAATTTMADAVRIAVAAHGGAGVEEVDIDREGSTALWRVTFDDESRTSVSLSDGRVVSSTN